MIFTQASKNQTKIYFTCNDYRGWDKVLRPLHAIWKEEQYECKSKTDTWVLASLAVIIVTDSLTDRNWRDRPFILFDSSVSLRRMILHLTLFTNFVFLSKSVKVWTDFQSCSKKAWLISEGCPSCTYMTYFVSIKLANVAKKRCASVTVVLFKVSGAFSPLCCVLVWSWPAWWFGWFWWFGSRDDSRVTQEWWSAAHLLPFYRRLPCYVFCICMLSWAIN